MNKLLVLSMLVLTSVRVAFCEGSIELLGVDSGTKVTAEKVAPEPGVDVIRRIGDQPADYGKLVQEHDSGFDPYTDSPEFDNFTSFLGPNGDCMGISYTCRQLYLRARWHADQPKERGVGELVRVLTSTLIRPTGGKWVDIGGWPNLREASKDAEMQESLKRVMKYGQFRNLHPQALHSLIPVRGWGGQHQKLNHFLDERKPVLLAMNNWPSPMGHVVLAYKTLEFEKKSLIFVYDCNLGPNTPGTSHSYTPGANDSTYKGIFVYDKASNRVAFHRKYDEEQGYDYDNVYVIQNADLELVVERVVDFFTDTVPDAIGGLVKKLPFI